MKTALDSARAYLAKLPAAIQGAGGSNATLYAACCLIRLGLSDGDALALLREYNGRCQPPWTEKELAHKLRDARAKAAGQVRTFTQPKPAVRLVWKLERKTVRVAEPVTMAASATEPLPVAPSEPSAEPAPLPPDQAAWLPVARQVLAGEFEGADRSTIEAVTIGLRNIGHLVCRHALERLKATKEARR